MRNVDVIIITLRTQFLMDSGTNAEATAKDQGKSESERENRFKDFGFHKDTSMF